MELISRFRSECRQFAYTLPAYALSIVMATMIISSLPPFIDHAQADNNRAEASKAIPLSNADLDALLAALKSVKGVGKYCDLECPEMDTCEDAADLLDALNDAKELLGHLKGWMKKASDDHFAHFQSLVEQEIISGENAANAQEAIGLHQFLHDFGSTMLDLASVIDFTKEFAEDAASGKLNDMSPTEMLEKLDSVYETLKDMESGMDTVSQSAAGEGTGTPVGDLTTQVIGADINDAKSYVSDAISTLKEGIQEGKVDWKSIGQSVGRFAKGISASELEARKKRLQDILNGMDAEAKARASAFLEYQKAIRRRDKAIDAYDDVVATINAIKPCIDQLCGSGSRTRRSEMLYYLDQQLKNALAGERYTHTGWGKALRVINSFIPNVTERIKPPGVKNICIDGEKDSVTDTTISESVLIDTDGSQWCTYGGSSTSSPLQPARHISQDPRDVFSPTVPTNEQPTDEDGNPIGGGTPSPRSTPGTPTGTGTPDGNTPSSTEDPSSVEGPKIIVKAKSSVLESGKSVSKPVSGQLVKLDFSKIPPLPGNGAKDDSGFADSPLQGVTGKDGTVTLTAPKGTPIASGQTVEVEGGDKDSTIVKLKGGYKKGELGEAEKYVVQTFKDHLVLLYPKGDTKFVKKAIKSMGSKVVSTEPNYCRDKQLSKFNDNYYKGSGGWEQKHDDQWALKRVAVDGKKDAWKLLKKKPAKVVVAVIDSGLDWNHLDFDWKNIWNNKDEIPNNNKDDDNNGYVDDMIGWDFWNQNNQPWDKDGHGTFVSGIIAASSNNKAGMVGMNPHAQIMVLKSLNSFGHSRASFVAEAIYYAADNGAQVINLSVGGKNLTQVEQDAIDYAHNKGAVIIVASGNEGTDTSNFGPAGADKVITVSSTDLKDKRTVFSNWGKAVSIAAPGIDVLSLRARRTDLMEGIPGVEYKQGEAYVGEDNRYYRASGTSFSAPFVAGAASLLLSNDPGLSNEDVKRILLQSADDIETPGIDQYTGHGLLNVVAALQADKSFYIEAAITGVQVVQQSNQVLVQVSGTANADKYQSAKISIGSGKNPTQWKEVVTGIDKPVVDGVLGGIDANHLRSSTQWMIRLEVTHNNGQNRQTWFELNLN